MKTIETNAGRFSVRFISFFDGRSDYGVTKCGPGAKEGRVSEQDGKVFVNFPEEFEKDYGFTFDDAKAAAEQYIGETFDADVRYIVKRGRIEFADEKVRAHAIKHGLIPA